MDVRVPKENLLNGVRILDLADEKASFCSKLLADMGASVIKIERPGGDASRGIAPFLGDSAHSKKSLFFEYYNTNKLGITLNLEHPEGRAIFLRLLKANDIVVETFLPGHLKNLRLGFEVLNRINPKIVLASVTGFGQDGPRNQFKSCDLVASAFSGQMYVSGSPSSPPLKAFGEQSYYAGSLFAAIAILLALRKRAITGRGEHIDISLQEAVTSTLEHVIIRYFYERIIPERQGSLHWDRSFCILPCRDGHLLMTPFQQWGTLVEWIQSEGMSEDLGDERYCEEGFRLSHFDHIVDVLGKWTRTHTTDELFQLGQAMRFPWAPVLLPKEVLDSPQMRARDFFVEVDHPEMESGPKNLKFPSAPYRLSSGPLHQRRRAPLIGEHNVQIYQGELGLSEKEIERLSSIGVI